MTEETFAKGMAILENAFPNRVMNARIYWDILKDLQDAEFERAVLQIVGRTPKLWPDDNLIAMIRDEVFGKTADQALLAWDEARRAIISVGLYRSVSFQNKITNGVIDAMGGWEKFCSMLVEEEPFRQKDFVNLYNAILKTGRHCPERLTGWHERLNGRPEETVMIGVEKEQKQIEAKCA